MVRSNLKNNKKNIVIQIQLILINPRPYSIAWPATLRAAVSDIDNLDEKIFVPLDKVFHNGNGTFLQGKVTNIKIESGNTGNVVLQDGETIPYEVLVLSPGSIWTGPIAFPEEDEKVKGFIRNSRSAFQRAQNIVLAGGGAVGIELAGEIKDLWPAFRIRGLLALLNNAYPDKLRTRLESRVREMGIDIIFNDYVDQLELGPISSGTGIKTRHGKEIPADYAVSTRGPRPNTEFIATSLTPSVLNSRGLVKILPTFQLPDFSNIFALGDVIDWNEQKQLRKASGHAAIVASNIQAYLSGGSLNPYKGSAEMIIVTLGKNAGVSYIGLLWGIVLGDWFSRMIKSKGLLVDIIRSSLGQ
ncbi:FAD/NAD(P)-binding domain containing protein [Amanita muscaria]